VPPSRDLNTSYLRQWRDAVHAGMQGAMCSYNSVSGVPACADADLLQKKMREEWGCRECMIISDAGAVDGVWGCDRPGQQVLHDRPVRRPLRPFRRPFWLRFTYVTSVLVKKY
jgi:beta-glucosidase-like glycosyl hydrolase